MSEVNYNKHKALDFVVFSILEFGTISRFFFPRADPEFETEEDILQSFDEELDKEMAQTSEPKN